MGKRYWTKEKVIAELKRHRAVGPKGNTRIDTAAREYFGSLRAALEVAGLPCGKKPPPCQQWSQKSVIAAIRRRHRETNRLESTHREDPALYGAAKRLFGRWTTALAVAGFPKPKKEYYTADEVRLLLIDHYEHELPLTSSSFNDPKLARSALKHFGGWRRAVESLGLGNELRRKWTKKAVIEAILHRRAAGLRLHTTYKEDRGLFYAAARRFGNWHLALQAAGIKCRPPERWSEEKIVERLSYYARTTTVKNIKHVDPNLVGPAMRRFGSLGKALEAAGAESLSPRWTKRRIINTIRSHCASNQPTHLIGLGNLRLALAAKRHFSSWAQAVEAAGLADRLALHERRKRRTSHEVLAVIQQWYANERSFKDILKRNDGLERDARRHFGSWRQALEAAGYECSRRQWSHKAILSEIQSRIANGSSLTSNDPNNINLAAAAIRYFGTWRGALKAAGYERTQRQWSRELILSEIKLRLENGASLNSRDPNNVNLTAAATRYFGSWSAARQAAGEAIKQRKPRHST